MARNKDNENSRNKGIRINKAKVLRQIEKVVEGKIFHHFVAYCNNPLHKPPICHY
jgi:hypothetical protein